MFVESNVLFIETLQDLLDCDYHQFWCHVLFEPKICTVLANFVLNPVHWYERHNLEDVYLQVYNVVFEKVLKVYERLLRFKETEVIALIFVCILYYT